jgi:hypothetical protein
MSERERTESAAGTPLGSVGEERATLVPAPPADAWTAPEPWTKRLVRAAKAWLFASVTHYSLTQLMHLSDVSPARAVGQSVFMGFWMGIIAFVGSRRGNLMPASPMLVFGGVTVGLTLLAGGAMLVSGVGARAGEFGAVVSMGLFLGGAMLWMGLRARRAERALDEGEQSERVAPMLIARKELAVRVEEHQGHQALETRRVVRNISIGCAVAIGLALFPYTRVFGTEPPGIVGFGLFFGMWGAFGLYARSMTRSARAVAERFGLVCSACDRTYHGAFVNHRYLNNIVEIGRCPRCGARIVTEDAT